MRETVVKKIKKILKSVSEALEQWAEHQMPPPGYY